MNRFLYAEANPWTFSDPSGHATCYASADLCDEMMAIQHQGTQAARDATRRSSSRHKVNYWYNRALHSKVSTRDYDSAPPEATPETAWADQDTWGESTKTGLASAAETSAQAAAPAKRTVICGGRSGCAPNTGGSDDAGTALVVAGVVVVGALVCIFGGCEAAAAVAAAAAAAVTADAVVTAVGWAAAGAASYIVGNQIEYGLTGKDNFNLADLAISAVGGVVLGPGIAAFNIGKRLVLGLGLGAAATFISNSVNSRRPDSLTNTISIAASGATAAIPGGAAAYGLIVAGVAALINYTSHENP